MGKKKDIPDIKREGMLQFLLASIKNGRPERGKINEAAQKFEVARCTVSRIWQSAVKQRLQGEVINVCNKRKGRFRAPKHVINYAQIEAVPVRDRGTIRATADAIGVPKTIVHRWRQQDKLRAHSNAIKPALTAPNKLVRLSFSLQAIHFDSQLSLLKFKPMENTIHIDEKWFFLTRKSNTYYMTPMEADPHRTIQSKKIIPKVMFMCAVCRPLFDVDGRVIFDGKIGIWPFVEEVTAKRNSSKRPRGTKEMKPIQSITRQVIKDCIINKVVPAIKIKWPACLSKKIMIQQDNARPHITNADADFQSVANADGFQITLIQQPPNSPDCNVLDLGFHNAIQSLQQKSACKNADELIQATKESFNQLEPMTLNKVFLSLQCVFKEILKVKGHNNYKQPHMGKNALILQNELPTNLEIPMGLVMDSIDHLLAEEHTQHITVLMTELGVRIPEVGAGIPDLNF